MERIYLSAPDVGELEANYVAEAMASGWVAPAGPDLVAFEAEVASRIGVAHGVALSSGTAALHLGLLTMGVGPGDVVLTSTMTFAATANAITYTGAEPYFIDVERQSGNIDVELLTEAAVLLRSQGRRIGALVPVDLLGKCADMDRLTALATELNVPLLVDAAESMGATYHSNAAGSFGNASVLSFNGNKIITTSGGGMLLTDDVRIADRVRYLSTQAREPVVHYEHNEVGYNYRLSNILAAIGRAQLSRLDQIKARRRAIRGAYRQQFADVPGVHIFDGGDDSEDNCWLSSIVVDDVANWDVRQLMAHLDGCGIESRPLWKPMHLQPAYSDTSCRLNGNAAWLYAHGLTLPSGSGMSDPQLVCILESIRSFLSLMPAPVHLTAFDKRGNSRLNRDLSVP